MLSEIQWGSAAEWAGSIASIAATLISLWALKESKESRDLGHQVQRDQKHFHDEIIEREKERRMRQSVSGVGAWWGYRKIISNDKEEWGLVIVNRGPYAGLLTDVKIIARSPSNVKMLDLKILPPGQYFVKSCDSRNPRDWDLPIPLESLEEVDPLTRATEHQVEKFLCFDPLENKWAWETGKGWQPVD